MTHQYNKTVLVLGGTFNPPHDGHVHASLQAKKQIQADEVWWLVASAHPTKMKNATTHDYSLVMSGETLEHRAHACTQFVAQHRAAQQAHIRVVRYERHMPVSRFQGRNYTLYSMRWLKRRFPHIQFIWLMGADNLAGLHTWHRWRALAQEVAMAVVVRPQDITGNVFASPAATLLRQRRVSPRYLPHASLPAWSFVFGTESHLSSSALRATIPINIGEK